MPKENPVNEEKLGECDVCVILDDDHTEKEVKYCPLCEKMLCARCRKSPRRVPAALKYHSKKVKDAFLSGLGIRPESEKEKID
jgi:hypothetical protein